MTISTPGVPPSTTLPPVKPRRSMTRPKSSSTTLHSTQLVALSRSHLLPKKQQICGKNSSYSRDNGEELILAHPRSAKLSRGVCDSIKFTVDNASLPMVMSSANNEQQQQESPDAFHGSFAIPYRHSPASINLFGSPANTSTTENLMILMAEDCATPKCQTVPPVFRLGMGALPDEMVLLSAPYPIPCGLLLPDDF